MLGVENATNESKAKGKPITLVAVSCRKNPKSFEISVHMLNMDSLEWDFMVVCLVFGSQRMIFWRFTRNLTVFMNTIDSDISGIHQNLDPLRNIYAAFLEYPKIMDMSLSNGKTDYIQSMITSLSKALNFGGCPPWRCSCWYVSSKIPSIWSNIVFLTPNIFW